MSIAARCTCDRKGSGFGEDGGYCPRHSGWKRPHVSLVEDQPLNTTPVVAQKQANVTDNGCSLCKGTGVADLPDPWGGVRGTCPDCHGSGGVEFDRDTDGELLIDWSPAPGRMVTLSLRDDGRLSFAFLWDGEKAHGTAQMPAPYSKEPDSYSNAPFSGALEQETVAEWTGLEPATPGVTGRHLK